MRRSPGLLQLPKAVLDKLAADRHIDIQPGADLFQTLWSVVQGVLQCSDDETLEVLAARLDPIKHGESEVVDELLAMDEGIVGLAPEEQQEVKQEQTKQMRSRVQRQAYQKAYSEKRERVGPKAPAPTATGRGGGRSARRSQASASSAPPQVLPEGDLQQVDLKHLVPPGGHIWRANKYGAWSSHYPGFQRCSKSWRLHGRRASAILVPRDLWRKHVQVHRGSLPEDCPAQGLFGEDEAPNEEVAGAIIRAA